MEWAKEDKEGGKAGEIENIKQVWDRGLMTSTDIPPRIVSDDYGITSDTGTSEMEDIRGSVNQEWMWL